MDLTEKISHYGYLKAQCALAGGGYFYEKYSKEGQALKKVIDAEVEELLEYKATYKGLNEELLKKIYESLEYDGWGYWLPEWCVAPCTESKPSYEEFIESIRNYE